MVRVGPRVEDRSVLLNWAREVRLASQMDVVWLPVKYQADWKSSGRKLGKLRFIVVEDRRLRRDIEELKLRAEPTRYMGLIY